MTMIAFYCYSKFWCRNRPGEEIKDKYNTFHNPFFAGEEGMCLLFKLTMLHFLPSFTDSMAYHLPGMGVGLSHGSVSLPPPSHASNAINLPPPPTINNIWKPPSEKYNHYNNYYNTL